MTIKKAIEVLKTHQDWRRGVIELMPIDTPYTIGQAIDKAIKELENIAESNAKTIQKRKMKRRKYANTSPKNN